MSFYERLLEELPSLREAREEGKAEGELPGVREAALQTTDKERLLDVATHAGSDTLEQVRARLGLEQPQN